jgi:dihydroorotase
LGFDLMLKNARIIGSSRGIDGFQDVAVKDGTVDAIGPSLGGDAKEVTDLTSLIVTPSLIDLHTHVYWGGTSLSIDADAFARISDVTTAVGAGRAGPGNHSGFRKYVIEKSATRILAYLHVSFASIFAFSNIVMVAKGCIIGGKWFQQTGKVVA